jgi:hypothetical protein
VVTFLDAKRTEEAQHTAARVAAVAQFALPIDGIAADPDTPTLTPQQRYVNAKAREVERKIARDSGLLVPTADVRAALQPAIKRLADHFDSVILTAARKYQWPLAQLRDVQAMMRDGRVAFIRSLAERHLAPDQEGGALVEASAEPALPL